MNTWIGLAVWVTQKKRTHPFVLCDCGCPGLFLMTWIRQVAWIGLAVWVRQEKRTHLFVICDYGCPRLDGLDENGGRDRSGGPGHVKREDSPVCPL